MWNCNLPIFTFPVNFGWWLHHRRKFGFTNRHRGAAEGRLSEDFGQNGGAIHPPVLEHNLRMAYGEVNIEGSQNSFWLVWGEPAKVMKRQIGCELLFRMAFPAVFFSCRLNSKKIRKMLANCQNNTFGIINRNPLRCSPFLK